MHIISSWGWGHILHFAELRNSNSCEQGQTDLTKVAEKSAEVLSILGVLAWMSQKTFVCMPCLYS